MKNVKILGKFYNKTTQSTSLFLEKDKLLEDMKLKLFELRYLLSSSSMLLFTALLHSLVSLRMKCFLEKLSEDNLEK